MRTAPAPSPVRPGSAPLRQVGASFGLGSPDLWVVLAWMLVGAGLRFWGLADKPVWGDEWATLVFSQGHSFRAMPLGQAQNLTDVLAFLRWEADPVGWRAGLGQVWQYLMAESTHPPLYFWLCHLWLRLWQAPGELVSVGLGRGLSAGLGVLAIPLAYGLGRSCLGRSGRGDARGGDRPDHSPSARRLGRAMAALMALSPFGLYLAQDARHYTLALLWAMASLGCFLAAWRALRWSGEARGQGRLCALWIVVNGLGLATHYFLGLLLLAQGLVLGTTALWQGQAGRLGWPRLVSVALGTLAGALPWVWFWQRIPGDRLTEWVAQDGSWLERWAMPLVRLAAWFPTMVMLLPLEQVPWPILVLSGLGLGAALLYLLPQLWLGLGRYGSAGNSLGLEDRTSQAQGPAMVSDARAAIACQGLGLLLLCQLLLVLGITYLWQKDLTLATRYFFVFLPGVLLLLALALRGPGLERLGGNRRRQFRRAWGLLLALGLAGSLTVASGHAFQKPDRADLAVQAILAQRQGDAPPPGQPLLMLTMDKTHEQRGELLGLAWAWRQQLQRQEKSDRPGAIDPEQLWFLITRRGGSLANNTANVYWGSAQLPRPYDLWEFNLAEGVVFEVFACEARSDSFMRVPGYRFRGHRCR